MGSGHWVRRGEERRREEGKFLFSSEIGGENKKRERRGTGGRREIFIPENLTIKMVARNQYARNFALFLHFPTNQTVPYFEMKCLKITGLECWVLNSRCFFHVVFALLIDITNSYIITVLH